MIQRFVHSTREHEKRVRNREESQEQEIRAEGGRIAEEELVEHSHVCRSRALFSLMRHPSSENRSISEMSRHDGDEVECRSSGASDATRKWCIATWMRQEASATPRAIVDSVSLISLLSCLLTRHVPVSPHHCLPLLLPAFLTCRLYRSRVPFFHSPFPSSCPTSHWITWPERSSLGWFSTVLF
jgi:hypothetical protein